MKKSLNDTRQIEIKIRVDVGQQIVSNKYYRLHNIIVDTLTNNLGNRKRKLTALL